QPHTTMVAAEQPLNTVVAAVLAASALAPAAATAAPSRVGAPYDVEYRAVLDLLYDGRPDECLSHLRALEAEHADDPVPVYLQALALEWTLEQGAESAALDAEVMAAARRAWTAADARLRRDSADARALFARGAASGVLSRYHLFRLHRGEAARAAAQMR